MAQRGEQVVKMEKNGTQVEVGKAVFPIYETINEAVDDVGEPKLLELINAQVRTNEMNRVRGLARDGGGSKALREKAMGRITAEEFMAVAGKPEAIEELIRAKIDEIKSEMNLVPSPA